MNTRLDKTYLNDKVSTRDFYTTYRNNKNKIEDPIITGFTFDIDVLHSPLFYALAGTEYNESLRSADGTDATLSNKIETKLADVYKFHISSTPDSYEINTLNAKDEVGNRKAGYGLQDKYYIDNVLYGAVDYIYMVDKVSVSTYTDNYGVTDVGNGTITNYFQNMSNAIETINVNTSDPTLSEYTDIEKIEEKKNALKDEKDAYRDVHGEIEGEVEVLQKQYDEIVNSTEYTRAKENIENLQKNIDNAKISCVDNLSNYQSEAEKYLNQIKGSGDKSNINSSVKSLEYVFNDWVSGEISNNSYLNIKYKEADSSYIKNEIDKLKLSDSEYKSSLEICFKIIGMKITEKSVKPDRTKELNGYKDTVKEIDKDLYGTHKDNNMPGTESNPAEDGLYYELLDAQKRLKSDKYSQAQNQIDELTNLQNNIKDVKTYNSEYASNKQTTQRNDLGNGSPSVDNTGGDVPTGVENGNTKTRGVFEVPQTVYDMMGFINGMNDITTKYPYILQTISGLDEAYKKYFEIKDPYMGSGDGTISIDCLEMLDLRVSSMFNKYFNAVYDRQYRRERVPINLRRFNCSVFVHDIRNFRDAISGNLLDTGDLSTIAQMALNYVSAIEFKFYDCEIIPEETGGVFDMVSNVADSGDTVKTKFTFRYGNCVINFLPFEDLRKYLMNGVDIEPKKYTKNGKRSGTWFDSVGDYESRLENAGPDGNFRRWYDRSELGNVNNNDYREYIRHDAYVAVDDHYKTSIVNNFALNSVVNTNRMLTETEDALRRIVIGISASTGLPVGKVTDALNVNYLNSIMTEKDLAVPILKNIGNVTNSRVVDKDTMEYIGTVVDDKTTQEEKVVDDLGNVNGDKK